MKPLSGMDASFLYMETPSQLAHVVGTLILDPSAGEGFSYERLFEVLSNRMHLLDPFRPRFRQDQHELGHQVAEQGRSGAPLADFVHPRLAPRLGLVAAQLAVETAGHPGQDQFHQFSVHAVASG